MKTIKDIYAEVSSKESEGFIRVLVVFVSPITHELDHRVAYFTDNSEARMWKEYMDREYKKSGHAYAIYIE